MSGEKNCAGTSAEDGVALVGEFANGIVKALFLKELQLRGALAAGKDEAVAGFEVADGADFEGVCTEGLQGSGVGGEVALHSEDADFHFVSALIIKSKKSTSLKPLKKHSQAESKNNPRGHEVS